MGILDELVYSNSGFTHKTVAVAGAHDEEVLIFVKDAIEKKIARFILVGDETWITNWLNVHGISMEGLEVIHAEDASTCVNGAIEAVVNRKAEILMKGNVSTAKLLKGVLNKAYGLRKRPTLSHVALFEIPSYKRPILITDAAMNIAPTLQQKGDIVENAVDVAHAVGILIPNVVPLAAVEIVNEAMEATVHAKKLEQMNKEGIIAGCRIEGPYALDLAISNIAVKQKGVISQVAGHGDILLAPTIEVGNVLYKSLVFFAHAKVGAIIAGANVPIVLTSRSDSAQTKLYSLVLAMEVAKNGGNKNGNL